MPIVGSIDLTEFIDNLGSDDHGLRSAGPEINEASQHEGVPHRATMGPTLMSLSAEIAIPVIYDVNRYYRDLGISYPYRPTRKQLRLAYQAVDGPNNERYTYCFKQLLNPVVRREYDLMPEGSVYHDKYVSEEQMRNITKLAAKMSAEYGMMILVDDLIQEHIEQEASREERKKEFDLLLARHKSSAWEWGYYLLNTRTTEYRSLVDWQELLVTAASKAGLKSTVAIGYVGETDEDFVVYPWYDSHIVFLNEHTTPTLGLAEAAVSNLMPPNRKE